MKSAKKSNSEKTENEISIVTMARSFLDKFLIQRR